MAQTVSTEDFAYPGPTSMLGALHLLTPSCQRQFITPHTIGLAVVAAVISNVLLRSSSVLLSVKISVIRLSFLSSLYEYITVRDLFFPRSRTLYLPNDRRPPYMSLFVIADTHLSLKNPKPMDIFGNKWNAHDEKLASLWKNIVKDSDTVVIAGDISWAMTLQEAKDDLLYLDALPGKKILLKGNHDYWWSTPKKIYDFFSENGIRSISILQNDSVVCENFLICGTRGWYSDETNCKEEADFEKVSAREAMRLRMSLEDGLKKEGYEEILVLTHFPIVFGDFISREMLDILKEYGVKRAFFGHIHGKYALPSSFAYEGVEFSLISADFLDFRPKLVTLTKPV